MFHGNLSDASSSNSEGPWVLDNAMGHPRRQFPREDIPREVIQNSGKVVISPAGDFELSEVSLPQFIRMLGRVREFIAGFEQDKSWTGNEVETFENTIHA